MITAKLPCGATMRQATTADITGIVDVYMDSFRDEIFSRQVFPRGVASSTEYWTETVREEMEEPDAVWLVVTEPASAATTPDDGSGSGSTQEEQAETEVIQGFLKWTRPGAPLPEPSTSCCYPAEGEPAVATALYAQVMGARRARMQGRPHWYLDMMGVRRARQGRGYARAMTAWGAARSARDGRPVYVDATGDARGFYDKLGFEVLEALRIATPQGDAEIYLMLWTP
ncbi:hypothetical protein V2A60_000819 [Cordyceps javanica]|uniref:Acetyltransferase, GNAT family n=1 Tax=Cordyceps javanica TaxID=43265 RepID=A0A545V1N9_9HYPO|nr:acetyltransferase, GNAT family [Cordyceps javanica]TQW07161.1 acetyltransferase, GNAT family [Cordyceps javanica]